MLSIKLTLLLLYFAYIRDKNVVFCESLNCRFYEVSSFCVIIN